MRALLLITCLSIFIMACNDDTLIEIPKNSVDLSDLKVGQKSQFLTYKSTCNNLQGDFQLTGDTLIVEIIEEDNFLKFKEYYTPYSPMYINGSTNPIIHKVETYDDFILIPERFSSRLFFFYGNDTIRINNSNRENMVQNNCRIDFNGSTFIGNEIGFIDKFEIGGIVQTAKTVVSCVPMVLYLDAYLIYDNSQLCMSHAVDRGSGLVFGFTLME